MAFIVTCYLHVAPRCVECSVACEDKTVARSGISLAIANSSVRNSSLNFTLARNCGLHRKRSERARARAETEIKAYSRANNYLFVARALLYECIVRMRDGFVQGGERERERRKWGESECRSVSYFCSRVENVTSRRNIFIVNLSPPPDTFVRFINVR